MDASFLLAAPSPTFDAAYFIALLSRVLHLTFAAVVFGGLIYLRFVYPPRPGTSDTDGEPNVDRRALFVSLNMLFLITSGLYNFVVLIKTYDNLPKLYHPLFGIKVLLALGVMFIAALLAGKTSLAQRLQQNAKRWINVALALALSVFILGAVLRSLHELPGTRSAQAPVATEEAEPFLPGIEFRTEPN